MVLGWWTLPGYEGGGECEGGGLSVGGSGRAWHAGCGRGRGSGHWVTVLWEMFCFSWTMGFGAVVFTERGRENFRGGELALVDNLVPW